jgi:hypothetical protein
MISEDHFTAQNISTALRDQLPLDANIRPHFYIKHTNNHRYTNDGTMWELVSPTQPLGKLQLKELYFVLRTGPYTLVLLGHEWRQKSDKTQVLGKENTPSPSMSLYYCSFF